MWYVLLFMSLVEFASWEAGRSEEPTECVNPVFLYSQWTDGWLSSKVYRCEDGSVATFGV